MEIISYTTQKNINSLSGEVVKSVTVKNDDKVYTVDLDESADFEFAMDSLVRDLYSAYLNDEITPEILSLKK